MNVKVFNDNKWAYKEKFKGQHIHIPAGGFIEMDHNEAAQFLGSNPGIAAKGADELQDPKTYKMLRIEGGTAPSAKEERPSFQCMACNKDMYNKQSLEAHIAEEHAGLMIDEEAREEVVKKRGRPSKGVKDDTGTD